jgi:hypothetical protein
MGLAYKISSFRTRQKKSVQEYYQELQTGMIRCGIVEDNEAMLACFFGGLKKEIQHILDYKEYNTITHLFHLACKDELEVQDRQPLWRRANNSAGRTSSWSARQSAPPSCGDAPGPSTSRYTRTHQERHLLLLHHHLLVRHGVLPWPPRGRLPTFNVANVLGLVTSKKNVEPNV